jgi:hypothetical protein
MQEITVSVKLGKGRLSASGNYLILQSDPLSLYVKPGATEPHYCLLAGEFIKYNAANYAKYRPERQFVRDCLHSAEEVIAGKALDIGGVNSKVAGTTDLFGESDQKNIKLATTYALNNLAAPNVGQAYVTVATDPKATYPYHAAAVVAQDVQDQVTIEVFARETDAQARNASGTFDMYTIGDVNTSFHGRWKTLDLFGSQSAPVTIVIEHL